MNNKKLYVTLELKVLCFDELTFVRTSGEPDAPTANVVGGGAIQWQDSWN